MVRKSGAKTEFRAFEDELKRCWDLFEQLFKERTPMKSMTLRTKLFAGSLAMVILVMVASAIVVSIVINKQNRTASYQNLEKSLNIIREELLVTQKKLLSDARQMVIANNMGGKLSFVMEMKKNQSLLYGQLKAMAIDIGQIAMTGKIWQIAIYNVNGELYAFSVQQEGREFLLGFVLNTQDISL